MTVFAHELRRSRLEMIIWTAVIGFMLAVTIVIYPQMASQMNEVSKTFSEMGAFSSAFGMDKLNFGEFTDYFCVECGNVLGLGGAVFAALAGAAALAKEERDRTSEFLFTHPVSRRSVLFSKLAALGTKILILNAGVAVLCALSMLAIGEKGDVKTLLLVFFSYVILQLEIGAISFLASAVLSRGSVAAGIGIAFGFYFLNIISNITEKAEFLKYVTPFAFADGAKIKETGSPVWEYIAVGAAISTLCVVLAFAIYRKKDL